MVPRYNTVQIDAALVKGRRLTVYTDGLATELETGPGSVSDHRHHLKTIVLRPENF